MEFIIVHKIEVLQHERFSQQTNFESPKELAFLRNQCMIYSQWAANKGREIFNGESQHCILKMVMPNLAASKSYLLNV